MEVPERKGTWSVDIKLLEDRIITTNKLKQNLNTQLMRIMMKGQQAPYNSGIQKEINDREKKQIREQLQNIERDLNYHRQLLKRMESTLPAEISEEELYSKASKEGKLSHLVQFKPDNSCTTVKNLIQYKNEKIKNNEQILHPITKRPIWCRKGIAIIDYIEIQKTNILNFLKLNGLISDSDSQNIGVIIRVLNSEQVRSQFTNIDDMLVIMHVNSYVVEIIRHLKNSNSEDKSVVIVRDLTPEDIFKFIKERLQNIYFEKFKQDSNRAQYYKEQYKREKDEIKKIMSIFKKNFDNYHINKEPYAPCQFPDPESGIIFDKEYLKYCKEENSLENQKKGLINANLSFLDLRTRSFRGTNLTGANLKSSDLKGSDLRNSIIKNVNLDNTDLRNVNFEGIYSGGIIFNVEPKLNDNYLIKDGYIFGPEVNIINYDYPWKLPAQLSDLLDLSNMNLSGSNFNGCKFMSTNFTDSNLSNCDFGLLEADPVQNPDGTISRRYYNTEFGPSILENVNISGTNFQGADMSMILTMRGIKGKIANINLVSNNNYIGYRRGYPSKLPDNWICKYGYFIGPGADLSNQVIKVEANFGDPVPHTNPDLSNMYLSTTNFKSCDLSGCDLSNCELSSCDFSGALLNNCNLNNCNLTDSVITNIDLNHEYHYIEHTNFSNTELNNLNILYIIFSNCDFSEALFTYIKYFNTSDKKSQIIFENCQMNDTNYSNSSFKNVVFNSCTMINNIFSNTTIENIKFFHCDLTDTKFYNCSFHNVIFQKCELNNVLLPPSNSSNYNILS